MDHYIKEALKDFKTVILPGFGALTKINEKTGELMFMDYLKHDDGVLAQFISNKEGISEQEAKNLFAKHIREITAVLNKGEVYSIYNFGTFFKDPNGNYGFEQFQSSSNTISETNTIDTHSDAQTKKENITNQTERTLDKSDGSRAMIPNPESAESKVDNNHNNELNANKTTTATFDSEVEISKIDSNTHQLHSTNTQYEQTSQDDNPHVAETPLNQSKKRKYIFVSLLLLLATGTICAVVYLFVFNKKMDEVPNKTQVANKTAPNSIPETKNETPVGLNTSEQNEINDTIEKELTDLTSPELESGNLVIKPYKIVAGTFQKLEFAESFAQKLMQEHGIKSDILSKNDQNYVILDSFDNPKNANEALQKIKKKIKKAWILN
jgi:nucleoid DNA-binding protein